MDKPIVIKAYVGENLDSYCNTIDNRIAEILHDVNGYNDEDATDLSAIPSDTQREAFELMIEMLRDVRSLAGLLRYDLLADHTKCPEHDDHAQKVMDRIRKGTIAALWMRKTIRAARDTTRTADSMEDAWKALYLPPAIENFDSQD